MDKKNTTIGVLLLIAAAVAFVWGQKNSREPATPAQIQQAVAKADEKSGLPPPAPSSAVVQPSLQTAFATAATEHAGANITTLENKFVRVAFTDFGGAVKTVSLLQYPAALHSPDPFVFNELHADPILAIVDFPGLDKATRYQLVSSTATEVVYRAVFNGTLEVTRRYVLSPDEVKLTDPYQIRTETTVRNLSDKASLPMRLGMALGSAAPANALDNGLQLQAGYSNGSKQDFTPRRSFEAGNGFFGIGAHEAKPSVETEGPIVWAMVEGQFFTSILTPDEPAQQMVSRRVKLLTELPDAMVSAYGVTGTAQFDLKALAAHGSQTLGAQLYVGPKEYRRLANADVFKKDQDKVMNYGLFKFFSQILVTLMTWMHGVVGNWGIAILLTTLFLKVIFLPLTLSASRSAKRMQKLQPELKELKEKYKDNPQKQQTATMELFKKHKVNPVGGCLPVLITIPFFFGFYKMLSSTAELRFQSFLWAKDLTAPDTVFVIGHGSLPIIGSLPINILPIMLGVVMIFQMRLTPQPTVDNSQAKMMKFMPLMFMIFYYSYSCALALYSTANGLFTIGQQLVINRMKDAPVTEAVVPPKGGRGVKNVTPKKK